MKFLIVLLIACLSSVDVIGQACDNILLGEIVDFHDNSPLENAHIAITDKNVLAVSDKMGKFSFKGLCDGVVELEISHQECTTKFITVEINGDTFQKVSLEHHLEELQEVEVFSGANESGKSFQEAALSTDELEKFNGNNLGDALKRISGISSLNTGANIVKPVVQGLNGSRVLMLNNKVRMQDMEWGEDHAPNIDVNANQAITVIKGAGALEYGGDAIGGVIVLDQLPIARTDSLYGKTQVNLSSNGRGGNIATSLVRSYQNGLYLKFQGAFKRLGDLAATDYQLSNTGISEKSASFIIEKRDFLQGWEAYYSYFNSDIGILSASHIGNIDDLIFAINSPLPTKINDFTYRIDAPRQEVTHHLAKIDYYRRFKGFGKFEIQYDFQDNRRFEFDVRRGDAANKPALDLNLTTHTASTSLMFDAKQGVSLKTGFLARFQNNFANPDTEVWRLIPDYDKVDFGFFTVADYGINANWKLDLGLRYDFTRIDAKKFYRTSRWEERGYDQEFGDLIIEDLGTQLLVNPVLDFHNMSFSGGAFHQFEENQNVRFNYAFSQRAPNPSELFSDGLHHSAARIELGDLKIKSERSSKVSASYGYNGESWGFEFTPYFNKINDFILIEPQSVEYTNRGAFPVWSYRQTNAELLGVDVTIYHNWNHQLRSNHRFSWVRGTDKVNAIALINMPAANLYNELGWVKKNWNGLAVTLESQLVFEQGRFPPNINVFSPQQGQEVELDINSSPPAYHLLALDIGAQFTLLKTNDLGIGLRATNLLNSSYRDYLNRMRYFVDDLGRNISLRLLFNY